MRAPQIITVLAAITIAQFAPRSADPNGISQAASPSPLPSATNCTLFQQLYPPIQRAFDAQHLTAAQRAEVLKWITKIPSSDSRYAKWMRAGYKEDPNLILVFDAKPVVISFYPVYAISQDHVHGVHVPWQALNSNIVLDPTTCEIHATH